MMLTVFDSPPLWLGAARRDPGSTFARLLLLPIVFTTPRRSLALTVRQNSAARDCPAVTG